VSAGVVSAGVVGSPLLASGVQAQASASVHTRSKSAIKRLSFIAKLSFLKLGNIFPFYNNNINMTKKQV
jgi:hypothetical protein